MSRTIEFKSRNGRCTGAVSEPVRPRGGAIVLVHEWFGLNDTIRALVDRFAEEGFLVLAPDLYHGKLAESSEVAERMMNQLDWGRAVLEIGGAADYLQTLPAGRAKVAVLGFCMGGALALAAAANLPRFDAAVSFYGVPPLDQVDWGRVSAPVLMHVARRDDWVKPETAQALQRELERHGRAMELHLYDAGHAFMREGDPSTYHAPSAKLGWQRTVDFLRKHLGVSAGMTPQPTP